MELTKAPLEHAVNRVIGPLKIRPEPARAARALADNDTLSGVDPREARFNCGRVLIRDYEKSDAQRSGAIFAISVNEAGQVDFFSHAPYEKHWDLEHEELSPMLFEAVVRGRLEQDANAGPQITLKAPISVVEYFGFRNVPEEKRSPDRFVSMVHDEYIRIARILAETGMPQETPVMLDRLEKFFPGRTDLMKMEPFTIQFLADQPLELR